MDTDQDQKIIFNQMISNDEVTACQSESRQNRKQEDLGCSRYTIPGVSMTQYLLEVTKDKEK